MTKPQRATPHAKGQFQSTPSVWRETAFDLYHDDLWRFQSTPSVWRETRETCPARPLHRISIHSLRVEGDPAHHRRQPMPRYFNPLPPCGGRPQNCTAFRLKFSRANAILTKKNTDTLLHVRKNTFFLIFSRKSGCESLLLFLCA